MIADDERLVATTVRWFVGAVIALMSCKERAGIDRMERPSPANVTGSASIVVADASLDTDRFDGNLRRWTRELDEEARDALASIFEPGAIEDPKKGEAVACIQLGTDGRIRAAELAEPSADAAFNDALKAKLAAAKAHSADHPIAEGAAPWLEDVSHQWLCSRYIPPVVVVPNVIEPNRIAGERRIAPTAATEREIVAAKVDPVTGHTPTANAAPADAVLGKPTLTTQPNATTAASSQWMDSCSGLATSGANLYVGDSGFNRVLRFSLSR